MTSLTLSNVQKRFGKVDVIRGVDLSIEDGEFVVLRTFCPWCAVSAVTITLNAVLVTLDWRRVRAGGDDDAAVADDAPAPLAT